jgi:hypothetical protein
VSAPTVDPALQLALRAFTALLFGAAALHKLRGADDFRAALAGYALLPASAVAPVAALLVGCEAAIALGALLPGTAPLACLAGAGLIAGYGGAIAINLVRGRRAIDCGCGGPGGARPLRADLLLRNGAVAALLCVTALAPGPRPLVWLDAATVAGATATLALLYAALDVAGANAARRPALEASA